MPNEAPPCLGSKAPTSSRRLATSPANEPQFADTRSSASSLDLRRAVERWLSDGRAQGWSTRTLTDHRQNLGRFCWWLENEESATATLDALDPSRVRAFLAYLREARPGGRFGSDNPLAQRAARPSTVFSYYRDLRAFANFLLAEGLVDGDPLRNVKAPKVPHDQIVPLNEQQLQALLDAARRGRSPVRDLALILLMVDSGLRASEVCSLSMGDVDRGTSELSVMGKGGKRRQAYIGVAARRALWRYVEDERHQALADEPLFVSRGGHTPCAALTRSGLGQIISGLGKAAGITGVRVSPHSLRHTMAISFLRGGGNVLELQRMLGHEALEMTRRYVALADTDLAQAHRAASPADRMRLR